MSRAQWLCVLAVGLFATAAVPDDKKPRPPGPDWVPFEAKDKFGGPAQKGHQRPLIGNMSRFANADHTLYGCKLESSTLVVKERDGGGETDIYILRDGAVSVGDDLNFSARHDPQGKPTYHQVSFGPVKYIDLDGDGVIDCWLEQKNGITTSWIMLDGRQVEVKTHRNPFQKSGSDPVWAEKKGGTGSYLFNKGRWQLR